MQAMIFDLDGTLVDTVYAHVFAWQRALRRGMPIDGWRIHRRIGMSGGLFARAVAREVGRELTEAEVGFARGAPREVVPSGILPNSPPAAGRRRVCSPLLAERAACPYGVAHIGAVARISMPLTRGPRYRDPTYPWSDAS